MDRDLFYSVVRKLEEAKDKDGNQLNMESIIVSQSQSVFKHYFKDEEKKYETKKVEQEDKNEHKLNDLRSISKPIVGMVIGIAMSEGIKLRGQDLSLETNIWPFFEDSIRLTNKNNIERLRKLKLKHLLNHTMGHENGIMFRRDIVGRDEDTLLEYIFNYDIAYNPGEYFAYSNVGPYIISAMLQEELNINFSEFAEKILFQKIGITNFKWKNYGKYCAGASGLELSIEDLHKIGLIFIQDGKYQGEQIVPKAWIELMRTPKITTPKVYDESRALPKYAYGYYLWICKNGSYYCDGADGQHLIILPEKQIVIAIAAHQGDLRPISEAMRGLL
jgi:CubicO group peptidase (beta-lactamase class C family)